MATVRMRALTACLGRVVVEMGSSPHLSARLDPAKTRITNPQPRQRDHPTSRGHRHHRILPLGRCPACRSTHGVARSRPPLRLNQAAADRVAGELDTVVHAELAQDVRPVTLDRLLADHQRFGDLLTAIALGDQLDDLLLTGGQRILAQRLIGSARASDSRGSKGSSPPDTRMPHRASPPGTPLRGLGRRPL